VRLRIVGIDLPGRSFCSDGHPLANVHVGIQERRDPVELVPADADRSQWEHDVQVLRTAEGELDFRGPVVQGKRGDRFVYLTWGDVRSEGTFHMFRRAKLMLNRVAPELIEAADEGRALVATVRLTDECGAPRCARVDPPAIEWSVATG
jgi:hypothetical protein